MTTRKSLSDIKSFGQQNNTQDENTPSKRSKKHSKKTPQCTSKDCCLVAHKTHLQDSVLCPNAIKHTGGWRKKKKDYAKLTCGGAEKQNLSDSLFYSGKPSELLKFNTENTERKFQTKSSS